MLGLTQMFWNLYTVDACFIFESLKIPSKGHFAALCIVVGLLVISIQFRDPVQRYIKSCLAKKLRVRRTESSRKGAETGRRTEIGANSVEGPDDNHNPNIPKSPEPGTVRSDNSNGRGIPFFLRANAFHASCALLQTAFYILTYFLMLLSMYYNGWIFVTVTAATFLGQFIRSWMGFDV